MYRKMSDTMENMEKKRFDFMFGFENVLAIFKSDDLRISSSSSKDYILAELVDLDCGNEMDALKDCLLYYDSGKLDLKINDVIGIKINGCISFYRFFGWRFRNYQDTYKNFYKIEDFIEREKNLYLRKAHKKGFVLDVLNRTLISIEALAPEKTDLYAIDGECFKSIGSGNRDGAVITSEFSLYSIKNSVITNITPEKPFFEIRNALYFFKKIKKAVNKTTVLVLNTKELNMIRDYYLLENISL